MKTARFATYAYLAIILTVAALVTPKSTGAASGNTQVCSPSTSCTVGEFLYDDSYNPITTASCKITTRHPNGTTIISDEVVMASASDGWYSHEYTDLTTEGIYRTQVCCTPIGGDKLCLDKTFEVKDQSTLSQNDVTSAVWDTNRSAHTTSGSFGAALQNPVSTANDIAGAVWGYSGRSLSTFGTLVTDIWASATRTITGADLSSGSLATKSNVDSVATDVTTVKNDVSTIKSDVSGLKAATTVTNITNIQNTTNETRNLLENIVNKPVITGIMEDGGTTGADLQTKLEKSDDMANQLLTSGTYLKSKTNLIKERWDSMGEDEVTKSLGQFEAVADSITGKLNWISGQWDLPVLPKLYAQNKKIAGSLAKITSAQQLKSLALDLDNFIKLVGTQSDGPKTNTLFGQLKVQKDLLASLNKNYTDATTLVADIGKNAKPQTDLIAQINILGVQVAKINLLPKMNNTILSQASSKMDKKQLTNKALSLRGVVQANRQLLAQGPSQPLRSLWLEQGSIIFKTLISNPSKLISQTVPLKYYLPIEVTKDNIIKTDEGLTINYDPEKGQLFIGGEFTLPPGETKTLSVTADDAVFHISDGEISRVRNQALELSKPLERTSYFAQGVTLKSDIDASLDKVVNLQKDGITPEAKIKNFREAQIEFKAAEAKLEKLKELAANAGSIGTLFGFVGGAQTLAVWGLIIIMVAGFVFLALYMRTLRNSEKFSVTGQQNLTPIDYRFDNYEEAQENELPSVSSKKRSYIGKPIKYLAVLVVSILIGGSSIYALNNLRQGQVKHEVLGSVKESVASPSAQINSDSYNKEVNILVPIDSTVTIQSQPSINSPVLTSLGASVKAKEATRQDIWVKVSLQDSGGKEIEGWVDGDFVETSAKAEASTSLTKTVTVKDTPTGFLRVRKSPGGEEITQISPGEAYSFVKEQIGWMQIVLEDGTSGWVSKQYVDF